MKTYRTAVIGCSRMGGFIDNEVADSPYIVLPYSHAAGFTACERTELVACADLRTDVMAEFGRRYNIPPQRQYTDYREMIARENLDIVSVATQPEPRAQIVIYCAENGIKAIYAEKAFAASMEQADAMVKALEDNGVVLNLGTNRRWSPRYDHMKAILDSGELGDLQHLILYNNGTLFNTGSHFLDLILRLNNDQPGQWVQGNLLGDDAVLFDGDILTADPRGEGMIQFANGVKAYVMLTNRPSEFEAVCSGGTLTAFNDANEWQMRKPIPGGRHYEIVPVPQVPLVSTTLRLIEDLVHALDTGEPPIGGARIAHLGNELIFGFIESHRQGGARVNLPLEKRNTRLASNHGARQPKFA